MTTTINGTTGINRVEPTAYGLPLSHRNKIINGKMEIAQRGTGFSAANGYNLDRWSLVNTTSAVVTIDQQSDFPGNEFRTYHRTVVTTADAAVAASDTYANFQSIEGFNVRDLIGRTFTLSFWVRSSKTGTHCVAFKNSGADRAYIAEYTINAANTWEQKSVTVSGGLITAGTWNWTNGVGLSVVFTLVNGTTRQTTAGVWQTGDFYSTANQVNCLDTVGNIFAITGVQLEVGSVATPFEHRPIGAELALCQRYYWQGNVAIGPEYENSGGNIPAATYIAFPVRMRASPTIAFPSNVSTSLTTSPSASFVTADGFTYQVIVTATGTYSRQDVCTVVSEL